MGGVEAGAGLDVLPGVDLAIAVAVGREVAMTADAGAGEHLMQGDEEPVQGDHLFGSTGVGGLTPLVEAAFITHADRALVV